MASSCKIRWTLSEGLRQLNKDSPEYFVHLSKYIVHLATCPICTELIKEIADGSKDHPELPEEEIHA